MDSIAEFSHGHDRLGLAAATDREGAGERPMFDSRREVHAGGQYDRGKDARSRAVPASLSFASAPNEDRRPGRSLRAATEARVAARMREAAK
ncbi:MAG: hypothetical protein WBF58_22860 [Xanthobacteraceae bacterium]